MSALNSEAPSSGKLLRVWLALSVQSFGGGTATLTLIRRAAVSEQGWISDAEFGHFWGLVQLAPGINLLALTVLIGRQVAGVRGIILSLAGLLLPSAALTILMTAAYAHFQHTLWIQAALAGIIPAVVGIGLVTAWQIAHPLLQASRARGAASLAFSGVILLGSGAAASVHLPVLAIILCGGLLGAASERRP